MLFSAFWGLNWGQKSVFFTQENVAFIQPSIYRLHNTFLQAMNKWWKLNFVLLHVNKFCIKRWKIDWNIVFTWLKHNLKPVGLIITFSFRFYDTFFVYKVIQTSSLYEQSSWRVSSGVGAYWNPCLPFHLSSPVSPPSLPTPSHLFHSFIHTSQFLSLFQTLR